MNIKGFALAAALLVAFALPVAAEDYYEDTVTGEVYPPVEEITSEPTEITIEDPVTYTETGSEVIVPNPDTDITTPGSGEIASDNKVTIGGLDFGGFDISLNLGGIGNGAMEVVQTIQPPASEGLKASLETIFGSYTPRYEQVTYYGSDGTSYSVTRQVQGLAGLDFEWLATVGFYCLFFYCFMRIVGMVIARV